MIFNITTKGDIGFDIEESITWKVHNSTRKYTQLFFLSFLQKMYKFLFKNQFKSVYREGWLE